MADSRQRFTYDDSSDDDAETRRLGDDASRLRREAYEAMDAAAAAADVAARALEHARDTARAATKAEGAAREDQIRDDARKRRRIESAGAAPP